MNLVCSARTSTASEAGVRVIETLLCGHTARGNVLLQWLSTSGWHTGGSISGTTLGITERLALQTSLLHSRVVDRTTDGSLGGTHNFVSHMWFGRSSSSARRSNPLTLVVTATMGFVGSLAHSGWSRGSAGSNCCISADASSSSLESSVTGSGLSETLIEARLIEAGLILSLVNTGLGEALVDTWVEALLLTVCSTLLMLGELTFAVSLGSGGGDACVVIIGIAHDFWCV